MKIKSFSLFVIIGVAITGLSILLILSRPYQSGIAQLTVPNQISVPENYVTASISKRTILLLLAVGVIGVLGVGRKKKDRGSNAQNKEITDAEKHHN